MGHCASSAVCHAGLELAAASLEMAVATLQLAAARLELAVASFELAAASLQLAVASPELDLAAASLGGRSRDPGACQRKSGSLKAADTFLDAASAARIWRAIAAVAEDVCPFLLGPSAPSLCRRVMAALYIPERRSRYRKCAEHCCRLKLSCCHAQRDHKAARPLYRVITELHVVDMRVVLLHVHFQNVRARMCFLPEWMLLTKSIAYIYRSSYGHDEGDAGARPSFPEDQQKQWFCDPRHCDTLGSSFSAVHACSLLKIYSRKPRETYLCPEKNRFQNRKSYLAPN